MNDGNRRCMARRSASRGRAIVRAAPYAVSLAPYQDERMSSCYGMFTELTESN